jgi:hypothetical protein
MIVPIALIFLFLAAGAALLLWKLMSRFDPNECTAEWLDGFSLQTYKPMERLLDQADASFLASQAGYRAEMSKRLMRERRKIFAAYLRILVQDFNRLVGMGKLMVVYAPYDQQEFARNLSRQHLRFYAAVFAVRMQLALYPLGFAVDAHRLVTALATMREQVQLLAASNQLESA